MTEFTRANVGNGGYGNNELILLSEVTYQNAAECYSNVHIKAILRCPVYVNTSSTYLSIQGGARYRIGGNWSAGDHVIYDDTIRVGHNPDGSVNFNFSATISSTYLLSGTASGRVPIGTIPRYANITSFSVSKIDETSIKYNFSADATLDYAWYSINDDSWHDLPTSNIISGLLAGQKYKFKLKVRRADSQLTSESDNVSESTYDYPKCIDSPNFMIGDNLKLTLENPLSRECTVEGLSENNDVLFSTITKGTSITDFIDSEVIDNLYQSIPNSKKGKYKVKVTYNSNVRIRENNNEYSVNEEEAKPRFENFTYSDTNLSIQNLVANNQVLVDGYSTPLFAISSANKAVAMKYSQIDKYRVEWGTTSDEVAYSDEDVSKQLGVGSGDTIKVTAFDTRGLTATVVKKINNVIYVNAVVNSLDPKRSNGVEARTYLGGRFTIWKGNWQKSNNSDYDNRLKYVGYRCFDGTSWSEYHEITNDVIEKMTSRDNENSTQLEFSVNDLIDIHLNGESGGFTVGQSFIIQVLIKDGTKNATFTSNTYQAIFQAEISDGKVGRSIFKDEDGEYHEGINGMPDKQFTSNIHGSINVTKLYIGGELFAWIDEDEE